MATLLINRVKCVPLSTRAKQPSLCARALLLAVLFSHLPSITASPLPSLQASAPEFDPGDALAPASDREGDASRGVSLEYSDLEVIDPTTGLHVKDEDEGNLDYEDHVDEDERIGVDVTGNETEPVVEDRTGPHPTAHPTSSPSLGPSSLPDKFLASFSGLVKSGFWKALLGSFLVFWILIASTVGALVVIGIRVRRMDRSGQLRRWRVSGEEMSMSQRRKEVSECIEEE
ncbi:hypothetical protein EPUS_07639 [Endocarpon pusillum Z07020]|uniref:Transmembrane protein n=1 Tax=Endocarpon pusillum (strain Z07020 / HMAS-L-300199) TaxID=1263415 RepID=U1I433_ENDPU|nr:uncharacterized protein EPUS_07639 [Endocarpon pusillum Z07020]ERF76849.1 hypothetical protein EPUS_07639 [Endocarpon pusillum Z07020]